MGTYSIKSLGLGKASLYLMRQELSKLVSNNMNLALA